jgi:uncharacterized membrane protein HdeD (DUF308 family)
MRDAAGEHEGAIPGAEEIRRFWSEQVTQHWRLLLGIGVACVIVGVGSILVPIVLSVSAAILAGWFLLVGGVVQAAHLLRREAGWDRVWRSALAVLTALVGLSMLVFPLNGAITLTFLLVVWFFVTGAARVGAWWRMRGHEGAAAIGLNGALALLIGVFIWADFPSSAAWAIGLLVGIELVTHGMSLISAGLAGRRLERP